MRPEEENYQQTKRIKQTGAALESPFREVAEWIATNYGVPVLNVVYDTFRVGGRTRPRLKVIVETEKDVERFKDGLNFRKLDQQRVGEQFAAILSMMRDTRFSTEGLFVPFGSFEPAAITDANENVTQQQVEQLKNKLANKDLWTISRLFNSVTFLFFTDTQATKYAGLKETYLQEYLRLVEPYDEFGYVKKCGLTVRFDSKANFDTNYRSNWFYYYR